MHPVQDLLLFGCANEDFSVDLVILFYKNKFIILKMFVFDVQNL